VIAQGIALVLGDQFSCDKRTNCDAGALLEARQRDHAAISGKILMGHVAPPFHRIADSSDGAL
jgi:hypothetical protein